MNVLKSVLLHIVKWLVGLFFATSLLAVVAYKYLPVYVTPLMIIRFFQQTERHESARVRHHWVSIDKMSHHLPYAVIASEDQLFLKHNGFDFNSIENATVERLTGKRKRGASTISQQTAKNVFLWPNSSWIRKGLEVYFTVLIEVVWGKQRIMEVYLNSIEMGRGLYGAEATAQANFGCTAAELSRSDCALIAATLPNPLRMSSANPSAYVQKRRRQILRQMRFVERTIDESVFFGQGK